LSADKNAEIAATCGLLHVAKGFTVLTGRPPDDAFDLSTSFLAVNFSGAKFFGARASKTLAPLQRRDYTSRRNPMTTRNARLAPGRERAGRFESA
jgi:hypothetical protein